MAIYSFKTTPKRQDLASAGPVPESEPIVDREAYEQIVEEPRTRILSDDLNIDHTEERIRHLRPAFFHVDEGIKRYFSDIRVPSQDGLRSEPLKVRIAGGDKSILIWEEELEEGSKRVHLPVMSINREGHEPNGAKQFPAFHFTDHKPVQDGTRTRLFFAPKAFIINYSLTIWSNRKTDMEHIIDNIIQRFDHGHMAQFEVEMSQQSGMAMMILGNITDSSDVDTESETKPKVRYDISLTVEAWVPLEQIMVPTILGKVHTLHESPSGLFLEVLGLGNTSIGISPFDLPEVTDT